MHIFGITYGIKYLSYYDRLNEIELKNVNKSSECKTLYSKWLAQHHRHHKEKGFHIQIRIEFTPVKHSIFPDFFVFNYRGVHAGSLNLFPWVQSFVRYNCFRRITIGFGPGAGSRTLKLLTMLMA